MKFDYFTLYTLLGILESVIVIILIYYILTVKLSNQSVYFFFAHKLIDLFALLGFGFLHSSKSFLSLELTVMLLFISWLLLSISFISFNGVINRKIIVSLSIITGMACLIYLSSKGLTREIITATFSSILFFTTSFYLIKYSQDFKLPIFLSIFCSLFALSNIYRTISFLKIGSDFVMLNVYTAETIHILISFGLIILSTLGFFLLLSEIDKRIIFDKNRLNQVAFEQSPLSIVITDINGQISYVNPAFCRITGFSSREVDGKNPKILKSGLTPEEIYDSLWRTIKSGNTWIGEFTNKKKNGDIYFEEAAITPLKNEKGEINCFFALKNDITERKKSNELILEQNKELSELNSTKNRLFSIIAHDLKNPIGGLMSFLDLANEYRENGENEKAMEFVEIARQTSKTSYELLENLLTWSRSQLNAVSVYFSVFNISEAITETVNLYINILNQKNIKLHYSPFQCWAYADKEMVKTVVRNLVSNAIKFTPENGNIYIQIDVSEKLIVSIRDTGIGIESDRLKNLFSFSDNMSTIGTSGEKGTGLGLVLSNEFILKNGGNLWVESIRNVGSTFKFSLQKAKQPND